MLIWYKKCNSQQTKNIHSVHFYCIFRSNGKIDLIKNSFRRFEVDKKSFYFGGEKSFGSIKKTLYKNTSKWNFFSWSFSAASISIKYQDSIRPDFFSKGNLVSREKWNKWRPYHPTNYIHTRKSKGLFALNTNLFCACVFLLFFLLPSLSGSQIP
jgi:hypothetical protein